MKYRERVLNHEKNVGFPISIKQHPQVDFIHRYGARRSFSQASRSDGEKQSVRYRLRLERVRCIQPDLVALERPATVAAGTRTRPQIVTGKIHRPSPIMHRGHARPAPLQLLHADPAVDPDGEAVRAGAHALRVVWVLCSDWPSTLGVLEQVIP